MSMPHLSSHPRPHDFGFLLALNFSLRLSSLFLDRFLLLLLAFGVAPLRSQSLNSPCSYPFYGLSGFCSSLAVGVAPLRSQSLNSLCLPALPFTFCWVGLLGGVLGWGVVCVRRLARMVWYLQASGAFVFF